MIKILKPLSLTLLLSLALPTANALEVKNENYTSIEVNPFTYEFNPCATKKEDKDTKEPLCIVSRIQFFSVRDPKITDAVTKGTLYQSTNGKVPDAQEIQNRLEGVLPPVEKWEQGTVYFGGAIPIGKVGKAFQFEEFVQTLKPTKDSTKNSTNNTTKNSTNSTTKNTDKSTTKDQEPQYELVALDSSIKLLDTTNYKVVDFFDLFKDKPKTVIEKINKIIKSSDKIIPRCTSDCGTRESFLLPAEIQSQHIAGKWAVNNKYFTIMYQGENKASEINFPWSVIKPLLKPYYVSLLAIK